MSSDGFFGDDDFDDAALEQLDAIEAAHFSPKRQTAPIDARHPPTSPIAPAKPNIGNDSSFYDIAFEIDDTELAQLDTFIADSYEGKAKPIAGPSKPARTSSNNKLQTTLFGDILPAAASSSSIKPRQQMERTKSAPRNAFGQQAKKTKQWDQTQFAKTGIRKAKPGKGKGKSFADDDEEEEEVEFEQFPAPFVSIGPPPPMKVQADLLEAKHWIYPLNRPKRDYQYNIVKHALFDNTLVALPTGLGKTFIAGAVMLNYYRWFPEGKVVFVAPTKPLVAQQISACHETCGIPGRDAIEMNGDMPASTRSRYWQEKRVFYMTPQTLVNDLVNENCDVRDIVLFVVDEAHRATGDYAYNQVIRFLMAKNPHFRVLALTATPGNSVDSIQILVDGLHISRIEIRNEESLDLKAYLHKKNFVPHIIAPDDNLRKLRDLLVKAMETIMKPLCNAGVLYPSDSAVKMHPYRAQALMANKQNMKFFHSLSMLSSLSRAMLYLVAGSYSACYTFVNKLMTDTVDEDTTTGKKKVGSSKKYKENLQFVAFVKELELQRAHGYTIHPKIEKLKTILIQHFASRLTEEGPEDDTKVMVFSSYREVVDDIVTELNNDRPLIRATHFIGQGMDKQGKKGLSQKEQLAVIKKFKEGEYNVLVATVVGEEGLDIGDLDMSVCYDADKAPTRMIQRFGRTGRKREGTIHALLAEGREETNIEKAEATYKEVQKVVNRGELYELYGDVERLIPDHITPQCVEKVVEIEEYVREERRKKGSPKKGTKRKRNDAIDRNIPAGASTGFVSVRDLVVKGVKKQKKTVIKDLEALAEVDGSDEDIEQGLVSVARRTQSALAGKASEKQAPKSRLKKSATNVPKKAPKPRKKKAPKLTASQMSALGEDDSDDRDIESGLIMPSIKSQLEATRRETAALSPTPEPSPIEPPKKAADMSLIELTDSEHEDIMPPNRNEDYDPSTFDRNMDDAPQADKNMSWLVDDDDDDRCDFEIVDSSPPPVPKRTSQAMFERMQIDDESMEISNPVRLDDEVIPTSDPFEPIAEDTVEFVEPELPPTRTKNSSQTTFSTTFRPSSALLSPLRRLKANKPKPSTSRSASSSKPPSSPGRTTPTSSANQGAGRGKKAMLPPALPQRILESPGNTSNIEMPEASFPVRPVGKRRRIVINVPESPDADADKPPPASQRRLHHHVASTPVRKKSKVAKGKRTLPSLLARNVNPLFDGEAEHSGDEVSEGYSEEEVESESDRQFIRNSPLTQASPSYDQSLMYRRSLMTQAPAEGSAPAFANRPVRPHPFGRIDGARHGGGGFLPSSSPPPPNEDLDRYHLGSFVVDDDEEISYEL